MKRERIPAKEQVELAAGQDDAAKRLRRRGGPGAVGFGLGKVSDREIDVRQAGEVLEYGDHVGIDDIVEKQDAHWPCHAGRSANKKMFPHNRLTRQVRMGAKIPEP